MTIVEKLAAIQDCKKNIKKAIAGKGGDIYDSTPLNEYAKIIEGLPVGGGEPVEKVDYILTNSYLVTDDEMETYFNNGIPTETRCPDIASLMSYEINLIDNECTFVLVCQPERIGNAKNNLKCIVFEFNIPSNYKIKSYEEYNGLSSVFAEPIEGLVKNFKYKSGEDITGETVFLGRDYLSYLKNYGGDEYSVSKPNAKGYSAFRIKIEKN